MKKLALLTFVLASLTLTSFAQIASDFSCQQNYFYGSIGSGLHELELDASGGTIIDHGLIAVPSVSQLASVAYANDITQNSSNRTFYSTSFLSSMPKGILRWTGSAWVYVLTDSLLYHNSAGYGTFVYFQHSGTPSQVNDQRISRLNANGTLTPIFTDSSLVFSVADMAIDSVGNVYFFRGTSIGNTTELTVINPAGTIINSFSTTLNHLTTIFGMMFLNDTLYVGQGTTNNQLFPVIISGTTAALGTSIPMNISMNDLASCHPKVGEVNGIHDAILPEGIQFAFSPTSNSFELLNESGSGVRVQLVDMTGRLVFQGEFSIGSSNISVDVLSPGVYHLIAKAIDGRYFVRKVALVR